MYYKIKDNIVLRNIAGVYFILNIKDKNILSTKKLFVTNNIGSVIFSLMKNSKKVLNIEQISEKLLIMIKLTHQNQKEKVVQDVFSFISKLNQMGFLIEVK